MRVPARIYGDDALVASMDEAVFEQAANVAMLPVYENTRSACPTGIPDTVSP
jgi:RNA-splicing ligase RtcB